MADDPKAGLLKKMKKSNKKPLALKAKAKPGRGRLEPGDLIDALADSDEWASLQDSVKDLSDEDKDALKTYFDNANENFGIDNNGIGDALFGEDDSDALKQVFDQLQEDEKIKLVDELYDV